MIEIFNGMNGFLLRYRRESAARSNATRSFINMRQIIQTLNRIVELQLNVVNERQAVSQAGWLAGWRISACKHGMNGNNTKEP